MGYKSCIWSGLNSSLGTSLNVYFQFNSVQSFRPGSNIKYTVNLEFTLISVFVSSCNTFAK